MSKGKYKKDGSNEPSLKKCELEESKFDYQTLVKECVDNIFKVELQDDFNEYL